MTRFSALALLLAVASPAFAADAGKTHKIAIRGMAFVPASIAVAPGDAVEWTNEDLVPHTVTATGFDSSLIDPGKSWRHAFKAAGVAQYKCSLHPGMAGTVEVK
jgi:plastocyanin